jgi:CheY-like chemotaxis protein
MMLEQRGYSVLEATDGKQAVKMAWRECPDIILMDLSLPEMDGFEAAKRIREDPQMRDVPIVALTGHGEGPYRRNAQSAGINAFFTKPFDFDFLDDLLLAAAKHTASSASRRPLSWSLCMDALIPAMPIKPTTRAANWAR